jgi:murein L,D-transpeptidase YafK
MANQAGARRQLMFRFSQSMRPAATTIERILLGGLICLLAGGWTAPSIASAKNQARPGIVNQPDPDIVLIDIYKDLAANRLRQAQAKVDALVEAYPNFQLGHLIRGDLLLMHTRPVTTLGAVPNGPEEKLKNLRDEAIARLKSFRERPDPTLLPKAVLQLRQDQKHVLLVDAKRSRLYVYRNQAGRLQFVTDYYISQGKLGVDKVKEGDQKTPLGVYYITGRLAGARLPDFYGAGALPISYPNEWDKLNGRGGSGIWLHGTPSDSFSRPPLSSDGCVVLTNQDLHKLAGSVEIGKTPIVISDQLEFVDKTQWDAERKTATNLVETWRRDVESRDPARLMANYSQRFKAERGESFSAWFAKQQQPVHGVRNISLTLRDVSLFYYPGKDNLIVATFTQDSAIDKSRHSVRKRQYWAREGAHWKIIAETRW